MAGLGVRSLPMAYGASAISAYRDASGRVVFVNEPATAKSEIPAPTQPPKSAALPNGATAATSQTQHETSAAAVTAPAAETIVLPAASSVWDEMIHSTASRHQVDPKLVRAVVQVESNFNPRAVSSRGAQGLMQLVPSTARRFGVRNVFDPKANLDAGVRYLKYLMGLFGGDLKLSLAAYNAGENAVGRHNGVPPYAETQDYLRRIATLYPLSSSKTALAASGIAKFLDNNGVVHFSNTDMP